MSLELISTLAAVGTFVVIATTAVAALIQLRHLPASNPLQAMLAITDTWDGPDVSRAMHYVRSELPARRKLADYQASLFTNRHDRSLHPEMLVLDVWEQIGTLVKYKLILVRPLLDIAGGAISDQWDELAPTIALLRPRTGPSLFENFEYLAVLSKEWKKAHPDGVYPPGIERLPLPPPAADGRPASQVSRQP